MHGFGNTFGTPCLLLNRCSSTLAADIIKSPVFTEDAAARLATTVPATINVLVPELLTYLP
jgi:hypothetical protein